jgi:prepilin-type N-terminal cleavage/methylation domain-containing protein
MYMRKGTTMIELLLVIGILAVIATVGGISLLGRRGTTEFQGTAQQMVAALREAQSRAVSQASGTTWGVQFSNATSGPFFAVFAGPAYSTSTRRAYYNLPPITAYVTSSLAEGATRTVLFSQITGMTTSTTIAIYSVRNSALSSTISIATSGAVSY